jgi:hypothetical protein
VNQVSFIAADYLRQGFKLVPVPKGRKGPARRNWNHLENCISDPHDASKITGNMGLAHAYSRTAAFDIDDFALTSAYFEAKGVDLDALWNDAEAVRISSGRPNHGKLLFKLPQGVAPLLSKMVREHGFELRCADSGGNTMQDILPPSIHPDTGQAYAWEYPHPQCGDWRYLPELPPELLNLWLEMIGPERPASAALAEPAETKELESCLASIDPSLGYHDWIKVGMAIHHETGGGEDGFDLWDDWSSTATNYEGDEDLRSHWLSFNSNKDRRVGIGTLLAMASQPSAEDFDDLTDELADGVRRRFHLHTFAELKAQRAPEWFIKGVVPKAGLGVLYGETGGGKTFLTLDAVAHIAAGRPWRGHKVKQASVVYVCAEGAGGFRNRIMALEVSFGEDLPMRVVIDVPNFLEDDDKELASEINRSGGAELIVIDTLAQTTPGANENASEDMGAALARCRRLAAKTGATILLVHHAGKDLKRGARGWSGLKAAADFEIEISADGAHHSAKVTKQKDGEGGQVFPFTLKRVVVGVDDDGDDISSCVVEHGEGSPPARPPVQGKWQTLILECLYDELPGMAPDALVAKVLQWSLTILRRDRGIGGVTQSERLSGSC